MSITLLLKIALIVFISVYTVKGVKALFDMVVGGIRLRRDNKNLMVSAAAVEQLSTK